VFIEFVEAASFVALYAGLRIGLLHVNVQMLLQPAAAAVVLAANLWLRGGIFEPCGIRWQGLCSGVWQWKGALVLVFGALPAILFFAARLAWPAFLDYMAQYLGRLRTLDLRSFVPFTLAFTFMEELIARGYLQTRLAAAFGTPAAVILASAFFAWAHWTPGPGAACVRAHVGVGFAISLVLGWMYASTGNLLVVWAAHAAWDLVLLALMLSFRREPPAGVAAGCAKARA